ncbi:MAG: SDR family oxidoreductase [Thermoplasmata archaeon]|nr:SDR family oxidoreductase [Thermoplasmata archaeon]
MRALITGASGGIGSATARRLARDGWDLALHGHRHAARLRALARELGHGGRSALPIPADLGRRDGPKRVARAVGARWNSLDLLVLNAGVYDRRAFEEITDAMLERTWRINFASSFALARDLLPLLRRSARGSIVLVSSVLAFSGASHGADYAAAKAALIGLTRSLARELAPGIRVNAVAPGAIDTAILDSDSPSKRARRRREIPLARVGTPDEVASAITFLASPDASYLTGATLHVNGGWRSD